LKPGNWENILCKDCKLKGLAGAGSSSGLSAVWDEGAGAGEDDGAGSGEASCSDAGEGGDSRKRLCGGFARTKAFIGVPYCVNEKLGLN